VEIEEEEASDGTIEVEPGVDAPGCEGEGRVVLVSEISSSSESESLPEPESRVAVERESRSWRWTMEASLFIVTSVRDCGMVAKAAASTSN
jgi:hypothetical protein